VYDTCQTAPRTVLWVAVARLSMPGERSVSLRTIQKIADRERIDPSELKPPLYSVIDPDALDSLFRSTAHSNTMNGTVEFQYLGYTVCIDSSGDVQITEPDPSLQPHMQPDKDTVEE